MPHIGRIGDAVQTRGDATFEWEIRDFFSLSDKSDDYYHSPSFSFHGSQWHLRLYPAEYDSKKYVSVYLMRRDSGPSKTVSFTLGVKSSNGVVEKEDYEYEFSGEDDVDEFGCYEFLLRSDLKNQQSILMPNDVLTLTCSLKSDEPSAVEDSKSTDQAVQAVVVGQEKVLKSLLTMLESGEDSDVVIKVQGKEFPAHRNILRARSAVFRSMFAHDMVENRSKVVNIEDCDEATFPDFLVHIYSGSCVLTSENVHSLYMTADKYDVGELKEACSEFLKINMTVESFCQTISFAVKHSDKELIEYATRFFCDNSVEIAKTTEWPTFMIDNTTVANELFIKAMSNYVHKK